MNFLKRIFPQSYAEYEKWQFSQALRKVNQEKIARALRKRKKVKVPVLYRGKLYR